MARVGLPGGVFYDDEADCVCFLFCFVLFFSSHYCFCRLPHWPPSSPTTS